MTKRDDNFLGSPGTFRATYVRYGADYFTRPYGDPAFPRLADFTVWDAGSRDMGTSKKLDLSKVAVFDMFGTWPFPIEEAPINGFYAAPIDDTGTKGPPYPLIVIAHGFLEDRLIDWNGTPKNAINSAKGFAYLLEHLASHGFIAASIDCNFLNASAGTDTDIDARAIVMLEHVKQFESWNKDASHPLYGQVDLSKVILVGHSRGGRAAVIASLLNELDSYQSDEMGGPTIYLDGMRGEKFGPYKFGIKGIVGLAPTDVGVGGGSKPWGKEIPRTNYMVIQGSCDGDVRLFPGQRTYDRALPIDLMDPTKDAPGFKGLVYLYGGCHAFFNHRWDLENFLLLPDPSIPPKKPPELKPEWKSLLVDYIRQQQLAKVCLTGFALAVSKGELYQLPFHPAYTGSGATYVQTVTQYQGAKRLFAQHFEETDPRVPALVIDRPLNGFVRASTSDFPRVRVEFFADSRPETQPRLQETYGVTLGINGETKAGEWLRYSLEFDRALPWAPWKALQFRVGHSSKFATPPYAFSIEYDGDPKTRLPISKFAPYVPYLRTRPDGIARMVMQTIRIPLSALVDAGVDPDNNRTISFLLRNKSSGPLDFYIDDIQLTTDDFA